MVEWEADNYKCGSIHIGSLTFVEELFSLMTFQNYPCNNDRISET